MKQAVILAAGEGSRLKPFTVNKPKAMLSIAGKPIIRYVIESLVTNGIREIVIVVGHFKEQIFDYVGDGRQFGAEVTFVTQKKQLGTAHALSQAKNVLDSEFLVLAGSRLIDKETISSFVHAKAPALLIKKDENPSRYGVVSFEDRKLTGIVEKPQRAESNQVNTGIYAFQKKLLRYFESDLSIPSAINNILAHGVSINIMETDSTWLDVVYPWDIINLNSTILNNIQPGQNGVIESGVSLNGKVSIGRDTIIRSNSYIVGPVTIGKGCDIGPNVCIFPSTSIGDNVIISPFTELRNCVIGNDVQIASGASLSYTVLDDGCIIGSHFGAHSAKTEVKINEEHHIIMTGAMLGSSCKIGDMVTALAGTIIGNNTQVSNMKLISGNIPERSLII